MDTGQQRINLKPNCEVGINNFCNKFREFDYVDD